MLWLSEFSFIVLKNFFGFTERLYEMFYIDIDYLIILTIFICNPTLNSNCYIRNVFLKIVIISQGQSFKSVSEVKSQVGNRVSWWQAIKEAFSVVV